MEEEFEMEKVYVHGCTLGVCKDEDMTKPIKKPWTIMTTMPEVVDKEESVQEITRIHYVKED